MNDIKPTALVVGAVVVGGFFIYTAGKKRRCKKLPGIYAEEGPLHLTEDSQDKAFEAARYKLREYILSGENYKLSDIMLYVADELRDCAWEKLDSDEQKAVWSGIQTIVGEVNERAKADPDTFLKSF